MKKYIPFGAFCALLSSFSAVRADFSYDFNTAVGGDLPGGDVSVVNFAPQAGWSISDSAENLSFVAEVPDPAYGAHTVGLGGYYEFANDPVVNLTHSVGESLDGNTYSIDFAIINQLSTGPSPFDSTDPDDNFAIFIRGTGFDLTLSIDAPGGTDTGARDVSFTGSATTGTLTASDGATPAFYKLTIDFKANGTNLDYFARIDDGLGSGGSGYVGTLIGQFDATIDTIGASYIAGDGNPANSGSNYMLIDNINFAATPAVPESGTAALGLLALGAMGMRRRR